MIRNQAGPSIPTHAKNGKNDIGDRMMGMSLSRSLGWAGAPNHAVEYHILCTNEGLYKQLSQNSHLHVGCHRV